MSESIFETFTDERGNISVRISQEVQVLTREEANRIEAEYRRMQAENEKLRELCSELLRMAESNDTDFLHWPEIHDELRKLGVKIVKL